MFFDNILDDLVDILIYYYKNITHNNIDGTVVNFLTWKLQEKINMYAYNRDILESINVSFSSLDDYNIDIMEYNYQTPYLIKQYIMSHIIDDKYFMTGIVDPLDFNISLNVCPFEGLTIDASFVISVCNAMVY